MRHVCSIAVPAMLADLVDGDDVRMGARGPRFRDEARELRDVSIRAGIFGADLGIARIAPARLLVAKRP